MYKTIDYSLQDNVAKIYLNRPDQANGLNAEIASELADVARRMATSDEVKCVILSAHGSMFCAGGDLKAVSDYGDEVGYGLKGIADDLHTAVANFTRMKAPLIVAVNGTAAGAGFSLAVCGDLVLAVDSAKFTMAYSKLGFSPDGGASYLLPRLVGLRKAQELMFTNRVLSADEAHAWGLVNEVCSSGDLQARAMELASSLANGSLGSHASIKQLLLNTFDNGLESQLELESMHISANASSVDGREGLQAFIEKRKPNFS